MPSARAAVAACLLQGAALAAAAALAFRDAAEATHPLSEAFAAALGWGCAALAALALAAGALAMRPTRWRRRLAVAAEAAVGAAGLLASAVTGVRAPLDVLLLALLVPASAAAAIALLPASRASPPAPQA